MLCYRRQSGHQMALQDHHTRPTSSGEDREEKRNKCKFTITWGKCAWTEPLVHTHTEQNCPAAGWRNKMQKFRGKKKTKKTLFIQVLSDLLPFPSDRNKSGSSAHGRNVQRRCRAGSCSRSTVTAPSESRACSCVHITSVWVSL